jgi:hypothetical protein
VAAQGPNRGTDGAGEDLGEAPRSFVGGVVTDLMRPGDAHAVPVGQEPQRRLDECERPFGLACRYCLPRLGGADGCGDAGEVPAISEECRDTGGGVCVLKAGGDLIELVHNRLEVWHRDDVEFGYRWCGAPVLLDLRAGQGSLGRDDDGLAVMGRNGLVGLHDLCKLLGG